jgi:hypothetical protein
VCNRHEDEGNLGYPEEDRSVSCALIHINTVEPLQAA